jgi:Cys-tRNA(Pro)/Cys-tRNA(Cys) deacylase
MSASTPAIAAAEASGVFFSVHEYTPARGSTTWGPDAAAALEVDPARVFKTLVVDPSGPLAIAVLPVLSELDLKAFAKIVGTKNARIADAAAAERATGYVVGGISPVGQKHALTTVVDESARDRDTVYVSAGRRGLELELRPDDLVTLTRSRYAPIARRPGTRH